MRSSRGTGPRRKVVSCGDPWKGAFAGSFIDLELECGHSVQRRVRYRYWTREGAYRPDTPVTGWKDPSPKWVYCEECI